MAEHAADHNSTYYIPPQGSPWPVLTGLGLFLVAVGGADFIQETTNFGRDVLGRTGHDGKFVFAAGVVWLLFILFMWWRDTIKESLSGLHSPQLGTSYRMGMAWFIFSEVMFFGAFFTALFYTRWLSIPWLGGYGGKGITHEILWPNFQAIWPLTTMPDGHTTEAMSAWGIAAINTAILLTSSVTITIAHHALLQKKRFKLALFHAITIMLGVSFLILQAYEYTEAYTEMGLTLGAGIYGSLFFLLTGFHGLHVTIGTIMLIVMFIRLNKGHFTPENHFAYEAAAWYWHFVDVVWLFLFTCVYWL
jgi:cytochrome c oxidase subunit 3